MTNQAAFSTHAAFLSRIAAFVASVVVLTTTTPLSAHPFHISTAEMEFNLQSRKFEVSLKLHAADLENALSKLAGRPITLENQQVDTLIETYLDQHFFLAGLSLQPAQERAAEGATVRSGVPQGRRTQASLVGREPEATWIWLYFELGLVQAAETTSKPAAASTFSADVEDRTAAGNDLALVNSVLQETVSGQINTVSVRHVAKRYALKMDGQQPWQPFSSTWLEPAAAATN